MRNLRIAVAYLPGAHVARLHAIDLEPQPSGNSVSDVYEALYPRLVYNDDPFTGDACQLIREDITGWPCINRDKAVLGVAPTLDLAIPLQMEVATDSTAVLGAMLLRSEVVEKM